MSSSGDGSWRLVLFAAGGAQRGTRPCRRDGEDVWSSQRNRKPWPSKEGRKEGSLGLGQTSSFLTKTPVETPFMSFTVCIHSKTSQMDFQRDVPTLVPLLVGTERGAMFQSDWPQKVPGDCSLSLSPSREYVLSNFLKQNPRVPRVCGSP